MVAKSAYRRLAQRWHPDKRGGDAEKFKEIKHAWELIESGKWEAPPASSFDPPLKKEKPTPYAGTRRGPPPMPSARKLGSDYEVDITVERKNWEMGCTVPITCAGSIIELDIRPSFGKRFCGRFPFDPMIGSQSGYAIINVNVKVI